MYASVLPVPVPASTTRCVPSMSAFSTRSAMWSWPGRYSKRNPLALALRVEKALIEECHLELAGTILEAEPTRVGEYPGRRKELSHAGHSDLSPSEGSILLHISRLYYCHLERSRDNLWQSPFHAENAGTVIPYQPPAQVAVRGQVAPDIIGVDSFHVTRHINTAYQFGHIEVFLALHAESFCPRFSPRVVVDKLFPDLTFLVQFRTRCICFGYRELR